MADDSDERPGGTEVANLVLAVVVHAFVGLPWLVFVTAVSSFFLDSGALVWGLSGFTLWAIGLVDAVRRPQDRGIGVVAREDRIRDGGRRARAGQHDGQCHGRSTKPR